MAPRVNYEDDIFFVSTIIKSLSNGIALEIDPDFFRDKVVEDIAFVNTTLNRLNDSLQENVYLIRRAEYMRELARAVHGFCDFLDSVHSTESAFGEALRESSDTLQRYRSEQSEVLNYLNRTIRSEKTQVTEEEHIVSRDEYRFLLEDRGDE